MHGLGVVESLFAWMQCTTHESFSLPKAFDELADGSPSDALVERLDAWVASFLAEI